ncbi:MAG: hypothetical protein V2B18_24055 [Pseudomonadota bacterium]
MEKAAQHPFEEREIRCPRLGGQINFGYCLVENVGSPCSKAIRCWSGIFDVEVFFRGRMTEDEFTRCFFTPPQPKMATLIELIEQARNAAAAKSADRSGAS